MQRIRLSVAGFRLRMHRRIIDRLDAIPQLEAYAQGLAHLPEVRRGRPVAEVREEFYAGILDTMRA